MATTRQRNKLRRDTAANWTAANPVLLAGEVGYETDTKQAKVGNGSSAWSVLEYAPWNRNPILQSIQLLTTGGNADTAGELAWNADEQTLDIAKGGGTVLQVGQEMSFLVYNDTASTILEGTGVFTFTGNPAGLSDTDLLDATAGAFILTGLSAALAKSGGGGRRRNVLIF